MNQELSQRQLSRRELLKATGIAAAGLGILPLVGCGDEDNNSGSSTGAGAATETVNVGLLFPLTGVASGFGTPIVDGFQFAFERINEAGGVRTPDGKSLLINPVLVDTESSPDVAPRKAEELGNRSDILAVTGVSQSAAVLQVAQVLARLRVPFFTSIDAREELVTSGFNQTFRITPGFAEAPRFIVRAMDELGKKAGRPMRRVAIVYHRGVPLVGDVLEEEATALGITVAEKVSYDPQTQDFSALFVRFKTDGIDGLILNPLAADAIRAVQAMKQVDFNPLGVGAHAGGFNDAGFVTTLGSDANNLLTATWFLPSDNIAGSEAIVAAWKTKHQADLPLLAPLGISGAAVLANALARATETSRDALIEAFRTTDMAVGDDGYLLLDGCQFDEHGANTKFRHVVGQFQDGVVKAVWPEEYATVDVVWPRQA
ncbi:MAG: ABC transporter substrate-binding protein [Dehalococcoidia bacterium]